MPDPLDYENPLRRRTVASRDATAGDVPPAALRAVPAEFDASVARTDDHAAVRAIEAALAHEGIAFFLGDDRAVAGRQVELFARAADAPRARLVAAQVFVRRQKLKSYPRQRPAQIPYSDLPTDD